MRVPLETLYAYPPARIADINTANEILLAHLSGNAGVESAIAIYIHVPFCVHFCHFCGFVKAKYNAQAVEKYTDLVCKEINNIGRISGRRHKVDSIYFGGGTASTLSLDEISKIRHCLESNFSVLDEAELTFEGDVLTLSKNGYLEGLSSLGFSRLSFGVQIADPGARKALNLMPSLQSLIRLARKANDIFADVCIDYIYGWPGFSAQASADDLVHTLSLLEPMSVELFRFEILDASPQLAKTFCEKIGVPKNTEIRKVHNACANVLADAGYSRASYTYFSKSNLELKYYSSYYGWGGRGVLGFGVGSQSFYNGVMWGAVGDLTAYSNHIRQNLVPSDALSLFDVERKELVTWPRKGWILRKRVESADPTYRATIDYFIRHGFAVLDGDRCIVSPDRWYDVAAMMHALLPSSEREEIELTSRWRAKERGVSLREEEFCVTKD
ncbi:radical SAM protein [Rhizobium leguminosarum]|uniref:radical SAM protein n=1 Tax=Rhizobium leguminosarum TaxID=384 RepID=UPI003F9D6D91